MRRRSRLESLNREISAQVRWIRQCGGDLIGYIATYGSCSDDEFYGDGGEAIYAADKAELTRLQTEYNNVARRARKP